MNQEQRNKLVANTAEWIKGHVYTELVNANGVEVWRCQTPGSNNLAFDICVTRYGIAVFGDIGHLTFTVGAGYGINFLRHESDGYLHGKLESTCKTVVLNKEGILENVKAAILEIIDDNMADDLKPSWFAEGGTLEELEEWLAEMEEQNEDRTLSYGDLLECIVHIRGLDDGDRDVVPAFDFLAENEKLLGVSDTWEWGITKPSEDVWRKLCYVRHAANAIMAQKTATPTTQVEYGYAASTEAEQWTTDPLAIFVADSELTAGAVIARGVVNRPSASDFLPGTDDILNHMANSADDEHSEWRDGFPDVNDKDTEALELALTPLKAWADKHCEVTFYTVEKIEPYTVTGADVAAANRYLDLQRQLQA